MLHILGTLQIWGPCAVAPPARAQGCPWLDGWNSDDRPALGGSCRTLYPGTPVPDLGPARLKGAKPPAIGGKNLTADEGGGFRKDEPAATFIAATLASGGELRWRHGMGRRRPGWREKGGGAARVAPWATRGLTLRFFFYFFFSPQSLYLYLYLFLKRGP